MARVPIIQNAVSLAPMTDTKLRAADFGAAGEAIGRGLQQLGGATAEYAETEDRIDQDINEAGTKQGVVRYVQARDAILHTADGAYYTLNGQGAMNARKDVEQHLNKTFNEIRGTLKNDRMKGMFDQSAGQERSRDLIGIANYWDRQSKVYNNDQDSALQWQSSQTAVAAAIRDDGEGFAVARGSVLNSIRSQAARNGTAPAAAQMAEAKALSDIHSGAIEGIAVTDPGKANAYLEKHLTEIADDETRTRLAKMVLAPLEEQQNDQYAQMIRGRGDAPTAVAQAPAGAPTEGRWPSSKLAAVATQIPGARITGGDRTPERNRQVGGVPNSQHVAGTALDFVAPGQTIGQIQQHFADAGAKVKVIQHDAGSGMHFHVQGTGTIAPASRAAPAANAPRDNDLNGQLARVDALAAVNGWTYQRTQGVKSRLMALDSIDQRLKQDDEQAATDAAWGYVSNPQNTSIRAIPPRIWARLPPERQASFKAALAHNAKGEDAAPNPGLYLQLSDKAAAGTLTSNDVRSAWGKIPKGDWEQAAGWVRSAAMADRKQDDKTDERQVVLSRINGAVKSALDGTPGMSTAGLRSRDAEGKQRVAQRRYEFQKVMLRDVDIWRRNNGGKLPTDLDIQQIADRQLIQWNRGAAGEPTYRFEANGRLGNYTIPARDTARIQARARAALGRELTPPELSAAYLTEVRGGS